MSYRLEIPFNELFQMNNKDNREFMAAIDGAVKEYCDENELDFDRIGWGSTTMVSVDIF